MSDSEHYLSGLSAGGLKFGLERIRALMAELGDPQRTYKTIHVVGTNGKTSVARMAEAGLTVLGVRSGSSTSPHLKSWRERTSIGGELIKVAEFDRAVAEVREATERVEAVADAGELPGIEPGERVTQFEIATAVSLTAFRNTGVEIAIVEAGLGGRLDATNVIDSSATVLTSVGLDHTEWLGDTVVSIAGEKLAVARPGTVLVLGDVSEEVRAIADRVAFDRGCRLRIPGGLEPMRPLPAYQQGNLGLAIEAVKIGFRALRPRSVPVITEAVEHAASCVPQGRLEVFQGPPPTILDVAHNVPGAQALEKALPALTEGKPAIACVALLADKDARGVLEALQLRIKEAVVTQIPESGMEATLRPGATIRSAVELAEACHRIGIRAQAVADSREALQAARSKALEADLPLLVVGSHHLVADARESLL